ncbi:MAG: A/G-specific adenine glycosylase [Pseudomonadota bacterium]
MAFETRDDAKLSPVSNTLLRWYDQNARVLPWRVGPDARKRGVKPDPYRVWLSEIMLQQTTVATVRPRFDLFLGQWPSVSDLADAPRDDVLAAWAGLGYYARARNLHACAQAIASEHDGIFPDTEDGLRELPGIGAYTAAAIAAIAFDRPCAVVDGNVERVVSRLFAIDTPLPLAKKEIGTRTAEIWPDARSGDFAQSLMDLGATICRPRAPACNACPITDNCKASKAPSPERYPVKPPKRKKPIRRGVAFALFNGRGDILLERRPEKGLLGGMLGLPGTRWEPTLMNKEAGAPTTVDWAQAGKITHVFTHFRLELDVYRARAPKGFRKPSTMVWMKPDEAKLPTVMRKAVEVLAL